MDSSQQKFQTWLTHTFPNPQTIDYFEANLPPGFSYMLTLYGWAVGNLPPETPIEIYCATYNGEAGSPRVVATAVDEFLPITLPERTDIVVPISAASGS